MNRNTLILVADDNPQNVQFLCTLLLEEGYEVGAAQDGEAALRFVSERQPDLILLDIMMPGKDGYAVCSSLKSNRLTSHIPIIFLTAKSEKADLIKGFAVGGNDYVTKPFFSAELLARVRAHIEINQLRHLLSVCSHCRRVRNESGSWLRLEEYVKKHTETAFSHGICDDCSREFYGDLD